MNTKLLPVCTLLCLGILLHTSQATGIEIIDIPNNKGYDFIPDSDIKKQLAYLEFENQHLKAVVAKQEALINTYKKIEQLHKNGADGASKK